MSIVNKSLIPAAATLSQRFTNPLPGQGDRRLAIQVAVDDRETRKALPGFDGLERAFALVPHDAGSGNVEWRRTDLSYFFVNNGNGPIANPKDLHVGDALLTEADAKLVQQYGIALGMDTNQGTVWAQSPDENLKVQVDSVGY